MNSFLAIFFATAIGLWLLSFVVEAFRTVPQVPRSLPWAPEIPIRYLEIEGSKIRYITTGNGRAVVLLHTLRTQLDLFQKVVPELAKSFKIFALDYPGHDYSDIPKDRYDADFFVRYVEQFLDALNLRDALLVGVSIGASIALILAGRRNPHISSVVAINPYDYDKGRGMARSSLLGRTYIFIADSYIGRIRNAPKEFHHNEEYPARRCQESSKHSP